MIQRQPVPGRYSGTAAAGTAAAVTAATGATARIAPGASRNAPPINRIAPELLIAARLAARLRRSTARLVPRLATVAMRVTCSEAWKSLGFACARDFARERLDRSGSWLRQQARLGRACQEIPALADAITGADGGNRLGRAFAYEIARVARPDNIADWIQRARGCTIHQFKEMVRRAQDEAPSAAATCPSRRRESLKTRMPLFLRGALLDVERVFLATNPGSRREELLDVLIAEQASGTSSGMIDVGQAHASGSRRAGMDQRLGVLPGGPGLSCEPGPLHDDAAADERTTNRELLQARWTLHRVQLFVESLEAATESGDSLEGNHASGGSVSAEDLEQNMRDILALEHEVKLRIDRLLLWLDHRRAWSLLGFAGAAEFGQRVLDESTSTTRNRLRLARAMERSTTLQRSAESGRLSHQRLVRLVQLMQQRLNKAGRLTERNETIMQQWVDIAAPIPIKRLDEDLDAVERRRWSAPGSAAGSTVGATPGSAAEPGQASIQQDAPVPEASGRDGTMPLAARPEAAADPNQLPLPPSDDEWQASLRLVPGDARRRLLVGGLRALTTETPVNVCHRFTGPADTIRDLRHSLNLERVRLAEQGRRLVRSRGSMPGAMSPADESRLFPSIRLAARHVERGTPIPDWICLLSLLEEFVEEWDNPRNMPRRPTDAIAARDGWRCTAPGCTSREIEVHHIVYRSHGGSDDPSNLTSLCPFHHRMGEHGGLLELTGTAPLNLCWRIGDRVYVNDRLVAGGP